MRQFWTPAPQISVLLAALLISGCTTEASDLSIQSKFVVPMGDYNPLGYVSAEKKSTKFLSAPEFTREEFLDLQNKALSSQPNADLMVNYVVSSRVTQIFPLPLYLTTFRVEGTAVNLVEAGGQIYRNSTGTPPARTN